MPPIELPQAMRTIRRRAFEVVALRLTGGEALVPPARLHSVGDSDFRKTGEEFVALFRELVELSPSERVLDVGCGIGRMARPLAGYLNREGSYDGFDVSEIAIRWCQRHYGRRYPNFHFKHVNVANSSYNPGRGVGADAFAFPYPASSFDFVFLTSVFTHMLAPGVERYMREVSRVLAPGGRCLATFFLLNDDSRALIAQGRSTQPFVDVATPYAIVDPAKPEHAVAYEEAWVRGQFDEVGLTQRTPPHYGSWCGRTEFRSYQDIVIADRSESAPE
jgi:SAM-dependent methyltransferase